MPSFRIQLERIINTGGFLSFGLNACSRNVGVLTEKLHIKHGETSVFGSFAGMPGGRVPGDRIAVSKPSRIPRQLIAQNRQTLLNAQRLIANLHLCFQRQEPGIQGPGCRLAE
jgi:hypothetical protein